MQPKEVGLGVSMKTHHEGKVQQNSPDSVSCGVNQLDRKAGELKESFCLLLPYFLHIYL